MLIDKTHLGWGLGSGAVLGVATAGYAISVAGPGEGSGGSVAGLAFGLLSLAAMTFAGLLAVRKKFPGLRLGSAQFWLRGHIWLGLLSVPLAFYHSSFRFGGTLEKVFMIVFLAVIVSGVYGLAMQQMLPRFLKVRVPLETFPQQIPYLCQKFLEEGDQLIKELQGPAKKTGPPSSVGAAEGAAPAAPSAAKAALAAKMAAKSVAERPAAVTAPVAEKTEDAAAAALEAAPAAAPAAPTPAAPRSAALAAILAAKAAKAAAAKATTENADAAEKPPIEKPAVAEKTVPAKPASVIKPAPAPADAAMPRLELLTRFYRERVTPFLSSDAELASRQELASENYARMAFANLAVDLPAQALAAIQRLEELVAERRQFLVQLRIQNWLRNWLLIHVPLSAALFVLAALHVIVALRVVPWF